MTKLHTALMQGKGREALRVIETGEAPLDAQDDAGRTGLMLAIAQSMNSVAEKLLEKQARTDLTDKYNRTALDMAIDCENEAGRNMLYRRLDAAGIQAETDKAARRGDVNALAFLVDEMGASLVAKNARGKSALDEAHLETQFDAAAYIDDKIAALPDEVAHTLRAGARKPVKPMKTIVLKKN